MPIIRETPFLLWNEPSNDPLKEVTCGQPKRKDSTGTRPTDGLFDKGPHSNGLSVKQMPHRLQERKMSRQQTACPSPITWHSIAKECFLAERQPVESALWVGGNPLLPRWVQETYPGMQAVRATGKARKRGEAIFISAGTLYGLCAYDHASGALPTLWAAKRKRAHGKPIVGPVRKRKAARSTQQTSASPVEKRNGHVGPGWRLPCIPAAALHAPEAKTSRGGSPPASSDVESYRAFYARRPERSRNATRTR